MPNRLCRVGASALLLPLLATGMVLGAQDVEGLRGRFTIPIGAATRAPILRGVPGATSTTPLAFGASWGDAFIGAGYQGSTRGVARPGEPLPDNGRNDGTVTIGAGLGDARTLGLEVALTALSTVRSGFGQRSALSIKAHRVVSRRMAIAVGVENAVVMGGGATDGTSSWFAVASRVFPVAAGADGGAPPGSMALAVSAGVGNGRFRRSTDIRNDRHAVNGFAAVALLLNAHVSALTEYTGQDVNAGLSVVPFRRWPIVFSPMLADLTRTASRSPRFLLGAGLVLHYR